MFLSISLSLSKCFIVGVVVRFSGVSHAFCIFLLYSFVSHISYIFSDQHLIQMLDATGDKKKLKIKFNAICMHSHWFWTRLFCMRKKNNVNRMFASVLVPPFIYQLLSCKWKRFVLKRLLLVGVNRLFKWASFLEIEYKNIKHATKAANKLWVVYRNSSCRKLYFILYKMLTMINRNCFCSKTIPMLTQSVVTWIKRSLFRDMFRVELSKNECTKMRWTDINEQKKSWEKERGGKWVEWRKKNR